MTYIMTDTPSPLQPHIIFCDGSFDLYGSKNIGAGVVIVTDQPYQPEVYSENVLDNSPYEDLEQNTTIAEMGAVYVALTKLPDGADALIMNDNRSVVRFLNGGRQFFKDNETANDLHHLILSEFPRLGDVQLCLVSKIFETKADLTMGQLNLYDALAHNAAIAASGSLNRKLTSPRYTGAYSFAGYPRPPRPPQERPFAALSQMDIAPSPEPGAS